MESSNPVAEKALRAPSLDEVQAALGAHERWLRSKGVEGEPVNFSGLDLSGFDLSRAKLRRAVLTGLVAERADLSGADLSGADLSGADLSGARLVRANLTRADLTGADLTSAQLQGADLSRATLEGTRLRQAVLRDANLTDAALATASGLLAAQLGGTVLAGAQLPTELARFEGLTNVADASKATQTLFTSILFVCVYTWLTIASAGDAQLLNQAAPTSSRLPIVGIDIPIVRFFIASPLLLLCLYVYFHLMLQRLWEELSELPAVFPDGRAVDKKAYPWLLNVLVRAHVPRLRESRSNLSKWQARISSLLAWGVVPATVFLAWARYLHAHDWLATALHIGCLGLAVGVGTAFLQLAASTLRGSKRSASRWQRAWGDARWSFLATTLVTVAGFLLVSFGVIEGINVQTVYDNTQAQRLLAQYHRWDARRWVPWALSHLGISSSAHLTDAALSTKPANWSPTNPELLDAVRGADLEHRRTTRNLRYAMAFNAFCVNGYFQETDARWSDFRSADLRRADFRRANLVGINLRFADLRAADFRGADLTLARFFGVERGDKARFEGAKLTNATFTGASFLGADFTRADLTGANLAKARLGTFPSIDIKERKATVMHGANLTTADLTGADLSEALLGPAASTETGDRPTPTRLVQAKLIGANLSATDLTGADLTGADLSQATLTGTTLDQADLSGANLTGVKGLTPEQLATAIIDARTRLPDAPQALARQNDSEDRP